MDKTNHPIRKAAVLVESLDRETADQLLAKLPAAERSLVRRAVDELGRVDSAERDRVVREFTRTVPRKAHDAHHGVELDGELARRLASSSVDTAGSEPRDGTDESQPFRFLSGADPNDVVPFLKKERPQTIAVILSHLRPEDAADMLAALPDQLQVSVIQRLAELDETDQEVVRVVERGLEEWLKSQSQDQAHRRAGFGTVSGILSAANAKAHLTIRDNLQKYDRSLATRIGDRQPTAQPEPPPARMAALTQRRTPTTTAPDLTQLDGPTLAALVRRANPELSVLALAGATSEVLERTFSHLSRKEADRLRRAMNQLGPTRLSDMEAAQIELADMAQNRETVAA